MVKEIRNNLNKATCELLETFVKYDKYKTLQFQTGLHALHKANANSEQKINLHAICDEQKLHQLLAEHGIKPDDFAKVPNVIKEFEEGKTTAAETVQQLPSLLQEAIHRVNEKNREIYEVPASGMIAVTLNLVNNDIKNALIASQTSERTLQTTERITSQNYTTYQHKNKTNILKDRLYDLGSTTRLARPYIGKLTNEPSYLTSTKATKHLADLLECSLMLNPKLSKNDSITKSVEAFTYLSSQTFYKASDLLKNHNMHDASKQIHKLAKHLHKKNLKNSKITTHQQAINTIKQGMYHTISSLKQQNTLNQDELQDLKELVDTRIEQIAR